MMCVNREYIIVRDEGVFDCCVQYASIVNDSEQITSGLVQWTGLLHGPKAYMIDSQRHQLSFPLPFQRSSEGNGTDCLWSYNLYQVFRLWRSPIHRTPHVVISLTILHDQHVMPCHV